MTRSLWRTPLVAALAAASLAACIPVAVVTPGAAPPAGTGGEAIAFNSASVQVETGKTTPLAPLLRQGAAAPPAGAAFVWRVSDPAVLAVGADGIAKGLAVGAAVVTAQSVADPSRTATLNVRVVKNQTVVLIRVTPESAVMQPGEQLTLQAAVHLADGTISNNVLWSSSDNTVAAVNATTGVVTALQLGRVTIRAAHAVDGTTQVADLTIVADKTQAVPSAMPSSVVFGESAKPATPAPAGRWLKQVSGVSENLTTVDFVDAQTGFAMGDKGVLLATTDGGATWVDKTPLSLGYQPVYRCDFGSASVGLALVGSESRLYRTTDGGANWAIVSAAGAEGRQFVAVDAQTMVAVWGNKVHRSTDAGATWAEFPVPVPAGERLQTVAAFGDQVWVGTDAGKLYRKVAAGWASQAVPGGLGFEAVFRSATFGFVHNGNNGAMGVTRDGGATFETLATAARVTDWAGPSHGFKAQDERPSVRMTVTEDGGATWRDAPFDTPPSRIEAIDAPTRDAAWAVGAQGAIYRYQPLRTR